MGDGRVALIVDVLGVGRQSGVLTNQREAEREALQKSAQATEDRQRLLLFRTGAFERLAVPLSLVSRLEEFPQRSVEYAGEQPVVQYRGGILPLVPLDSILAPGSQDTSLTNDPAQVVVFQDGERNVGIAVDRILDIVEDSVSIRQKGNRPGLLGAAVVGTQVTDFVDLQTVLTSAFGDWFQTRAPQQGARLLLVEPSAFVRGLLRIELEMAGYWVAEAATASDALRALDRGGFDAVLASAGLPEADNVLEAVRRRAGISKVPVIALVDDAGHPPTGFDDCQNKFDRASMLRSVEKLAAAVAPRQRATVEVS